MIIGLTGLKGSGKSAAADYLCKYHNFIEYALASPLKKMKIMANPCKIQMRDKRLERVNHLSFISANIFQCSRISNTNKGIKANQRKKWRFLKYFKKNKYLPKKS